MVKFGEFPAEELVGNPVPTINNAFVDNNINKEFDWPAEVFFEFFPNRFDRIDNVFENVFEVVKGPADITFDEGDNNTEDFLDVVFETFDDWGNKGFDNPTNKVA